MPAPITPSAKGPPWCGQALSSAKTVSSRWRNTAMRKRPTEKHRPWPRGIRLIRPKEIPAQPAGIFAPWRSMEPAICSAPDSDHDVAGKLYRFNRRLAFEPRISIVSGLGLDLAVEPLDFFACFIK